MHGRQDAAHRETGARDAIQRRHRALGVGSALLLFPVLMAAAAPFAGGQAPGTYLAPVLDRYEPGDEATMVGYTAMVPPGWAEAGPYSAYLRPAGATSAAVAPDEGEPLGPLTIDETAGVTGRRLRVAITFRVPPDLAPGPYEVGYCNRACTGGIADLAGGRFLSVGVDPETLVVREWPLTDPQIPNLPASAVVAGPGYRFTAAEIRSAAAAPVPPPVVPVPTTLAPARTSIPPTVPVAAPVVPREQEQGANAGLLVLGGVIAAACVLSVLLALRRSAGTPVVLSG